MSIHFKAEKSLLTLLFSVDKKVKIDNQIVDLFSEEEGQSNFDEIRVREMLTNFEYNLTSGIEECMDDYFTSEGKVRPTETLNNVFSSVFNINALTLIESETIKGIASIDDAVSNLVNSVSNSFSNLLDYHHSNAGEYQIVYSELMNIIEGVVDIIYLSVNTLLDTLMEMMEEGDE